MKLSVIAKMFLKTCIERHKLVEKHLTFIQNFPKGDIVMLNLYNLKGDFYAKLNGNVLLRKTILCLKFHNFHRIRKHLHKRGRLMYNKQINFKRKVNASL